jgi:hypothetical protein
MTTVSLSGATKLTADTSAGVLSDTGAAVTVNGNAELISLTLGMDDVDNLTITQNPKLATLTGASALLDNGTSTTVNVDIHQNAFVASLVRDTKEATALAATAVGGTTDLGAITTTSGLKDLDAYITDAIAATGTVSVWFDTVTKLETQAAFGGTYTDVTSSLVAPTAWDDTTAAGNADNFSSQYEGYYAYAFSLEGSSAVTSTTGNRDFQALTYSYDVGRANASYTDKALATNEGLTLVYTGGSTTWKQGDTYNGSAVTTVDQLVSYMNADTSLDGLGIDVQADRDAFYKTLLTMTFEKSATNGLANTAGAVSGVGVIAYTINTTESGAASILVTAGATNGQVVADLTDDLKAVINLGLNDAADGTNDNQLLISRNVSGGTALDRSPVSSAFAVTPIIDAAQASTTIQLLNTTGVISNTMALASGNFVFDVAETTLSGIRITLKNVGTGAFSATVSLHGAAVSNTAILTGNVANTDDRDNILGAANAPTYANNGDIAPYMSTYAEITAGTTTTTTAAVTAVTTNRTGW